MTVELLEQEAVRQAMLAGLPELRFVDGLALRLSGVERHYRFADRYLIPKQWEEFVPRTVNLAAAASRLFYGVSLNCVSHEGFDYLTAFENPSNNSVPEDFVTVEIAAARYAVFTHTAHVSAIPETLDRIWRQWAPCSGLPIAEAPCFEKYTAEFDACTGMGGMELWVPVSR